MKLLKAIDGTILDVYVKPNSKEFKMALEDDELIVFCRETPVKGRVNKELMKELSNLFKRRVDILSGFTSRQKRLLIVDADEDEIQRIISNHIK